MKAILQAGLVYFATTFAVGFALGLVRVPLLVPRLGERYAVLCELPLMIAASAWIARWVVRRFSIPPQLPARAAVGALALALMLAAETSLGLLLRDQSLRESIAERDPVASVAYLASLALFAAFPALLGLLEQRRERL